MPSTTVTAEHYVRGRIEFADDERPKFRTLDGDTYLVASIGATWVKPVGVPARLHLRVTADRLDGGFANLDFDSGHAPVDDLLVEHLPALLEAMVPHGLPSRLAPASIWFQRPANDDNPQVRHWALARWAAEAHGLPVDCDSDVVSVVDAERRYAEGSEWWAARPLTAPDVVGGPRGVGGPVAGADVSRWDPLRDLRPGDVAVGLQRHSVLGLAEGKERPLVVYRPWFEAGTHAGWNVFGLTATPRFASGCQRLQVRYPRPAGLKKETWLYSARPYPVPPGRLFHRVGKLTWRDIDAIAAAAGDPEWPDLVRRARAEKVLT